MQELKSILKSNGFKDPRQDAYDELLNAAEGLVGNDTYANADALLDDIINGGSFLAKKDISSEAVAKIFLAASHRAKYEIAPGVARDWEDGIHFVYEANPDV